MDAQKIELLSTTTTLSEIAETDQAEIRQMELSDRPSTSSGQGGHTTPVDAEKMEPKLSETIEKHPGQIFLPSKPLSSMSTCELKARLRARKLSTVGKKSTLRYRLLADIQKINPPKIELTESNNFKQGDDSPRILCLEHDCQELRRRDEQHRKQHEEMNGKFHNRLRGDQEPLEEYFFSMIGMSDVLNLPLEQTCSTIIAGLRNNKCSNTLAGVRFASRGELLEKLKHFEAPSPSTVPVVRQRHRQRNRFNRCFRCNNRHPLYQQCWPWQFNERY